MKCIRRYVYNWLNVILVSVWRKSIHFGENVRENDFYIFDPSDLDLWTLDLKLAPIVALVQH